MKNFDTELMRQVKYEEFLRNSTSYSELENCDH